ncbi:VOC family protein [Rhodobacteraceae bacterium CYK-10]|uniref:VOC family protein n=1 Tax=Stagnihabitans tardus TaxID=2699202 RepID=A0AAE4Y7X5_9RHOB|nr:VOC family protein [Stagnihabitans tardus]NBZ87478.1 VOC family protein [Stagnihabitans tardus]
MRLSGFSILVPDYDAAIAFYCQGLGFPLIEDFDQTRPDGSRKRWVTIEPAPGLRVVLARAEGEAQLAALAHPMGGRVWLFAATEDFDADAARITAVGGIFEEAPRDEPYGKVAVWRDPFGHRWDLIQPK